MASEAIGPTKIRWLAGVIRAALMAVGVVGMIALISRPRFDPGAIFGTAMMIAWWAGLLVWALGRVRTHRSRFSLGFLAIGMVFVALFLTAMREGGPAVFTILFEGLFSTLMAAEVVRTPDSDGNPTSAYRGRSCMVLMTVGGIIGLAHALCVAWALFFPAQFA